MRIAWVLESLELSGGVRVAVEQAEGLAARGHDCVLVTKDARHPWLEIGVPILEVPAFDAEHLPDADVHVATWFPTVVPVVTARRAKRIFHLCQGYEAPHPHTAHRIGEIEEAYRQDVPKLVVSPHLVDLLAPRYPGPYHHVPQSVDAEAFFPAGPPRVGPRKPPSLGVVGPFEAPLKGIDVAVRAVAELREDASRDVRLLRASALAPSAAESAILLADVFAHGLPARLMPIFYHACDVFLFTSFDAEGFGLPVLEAMASGVPCVVTDIPSLAVLPDDAVSRVPQGDGGAVAREAARLLDDPDLWVARRARGLAVAATFTREKALDRLEAVFSQKTS